jgi:hypothetical protein
MGGCTCGIQNKLYVGLRALIPDSEVFLREGDIEDNCKDCRNQNDNRGG